MSDISIKQLLEAGAHFGHVTKKYNPNMSEYINEERNGVHIINLHKTLDKINDSCSFITKIVSGGDILFVGTKAQAKEAVKEEAERCSMPYVNENWSGIKDMKPAALLIVDTNAENAAVREARTLNIPVIAIADTNCDPDDSDYIIPANDDALRSVKLILGTLADTILEAKK
jgi:small subunit ribosomal protein S2